MMEKNNTTYYFLSDCKKTKLAFFLLIFFLFQFFRGGEKIFKITDRDIQILNAVTKWRFLLARQIKILCGFPSIRTTDRRLKILIEAGYLTRKYILYGVPALYFATSKAKEAFELDFLTKDIKSGHIQHQIATIDTAIYFIKKLNITSIQSEREFKHIAGFQAPVHYPDFIYTLNEQIYAVEIELTFKNKDTLKKNININYNAYKGQFWIIPKGKIKIWNVLNQAKKELADIETLELEEVQSYVKTL